MRSSSVFALLAGAANAQVGGLIGGLLPPGVLPPGAIPPLPVPTSALPSVPVDVPAAVPSLPGGLPGGLPKLPVGRRQGAIGGLLGGLVPPGLLPGSTPPVPTVAVPPIPASVPSTLPTNLPLDTPPLPSVPGGLPADLPPLPIGKRQDTDIDSLTFDANAYDFSNHISTKEKRNPPPSNTDIDSLTFDANAYDFSNHIDIDRKRNPSPQNTDVDSLTFDANAYDFSNTIDIKEKRNPPPSSTDIDDLTFSANAYDFSNHIDIDRRQGNTDIDELDFSENAYDFSNHISTKKKRQEEEGGVDPEITELINDLDNQNFDVLNDEKRQVNDDDELNFDQNAYDFSNHLEWKEKRQGTAHIGPVDLVGVLSTANGITSEGVDGLSGGTLSKLGLPTKERRQLPEINGINPSDLLQGLPLQNLPLSGIGLKERQDEPEGDGFPTIPEVSLGGSDDTPEPSDVPDTDPVPADLPLEGTEESVGDAAATVIDDSTNALASITEAAVLPSITPDPLLDVDRDCDALRGDDRERCYRHRGWHTSTIYVTNVITISSCASTHTDCPYERHPVTTVTILTSTTVCPISTSTTDCDSSTSTDDGVSTSDCESTTTTDCDETTTSTDCTTDEATSTDEGGSTSTDCSTTMDTSTRCEGRWCHHTSTKCDGRWCHHATTTDSGGNGYPTYEASNAAATGVGMVGGLLMGAVVALL